jgi:hypothetical protein
LISANNFKCYGQTPGKKDTVYVNDESVKEIIIYNAKDSLYTDFEKRKIYLWGSAKVEMEGINMVAGYILIDLEKNEILASYRLEKDSSRSELPIFTDGNEKIEAARIRYNLNSKRGFIEETKIKQEEMYLHMGVAKKQANDDIHFIKGKFTTCDQDEPHYHFQLSKAVLIPEKRIVTGPMNLYINGVPTPLGLPFSAIPLKTKERDKGFLFPEFVPLSAYGFGVQNLGYYIPINDQLQTTLYANLYNRGSWGLRNDLDYAKRYGYSGRLSVGFQQFFSGFPSNDKPFKVSVIWSHRKDPKSNPKWNFSSSVNFISDNQSKNSLDPLNPTYFNNSFNSDVNLNRIFPGKPLSMGMKMSVRQNSITKNIALISPILNVNLNRIFPFKQFIKNPDNEFKKMIERTGFTYSMEGQNRSTFADSLLNQGAFASIGNQFFNGISQQFAIQTTFGLFKNAIKLNPSLGYANKINLQQIEKTYNPLIDNTQTDTVQKLGMAHDFNLNVNMTTVVYSYYKFIGKRKPILRHLMTPTIGYRYVPGLNSLSSAFAGAGQSLITYSPFERSIYQANYGETSSFLTFGINNTFELKQKSKKDTITGFLKTRLVDQFSITGNYDFQRDSMNLSNISLNLRISPANWINFVSTANFSPYSWNETTGKTTSSYALSSNQGLGRFLNTNLTTTLTIAPRKSRDKIEERSDQLNSNWNADFNYFALHPEILQRFDIPWKINFSHVVGINANTFKTSTNPNNYNVIHTLVAQGDVNFTRNWKVGSNLNFDLKTAKLSNAFISLVRNLHCWDLSFYWTPIGTNKSFLLTIRNTSNLLKDAKLDFRKPPVFL